MSARRVVQVVRSDSFAGVERYVADTAAELSRRGWQVSVVGGDRRRMRAELPTDVEHRAGATVTEVARSLWSLGHIDIVHAHMTAAELPAALLKGRAGGRLVVTRHFAARRGRSLPGRVVAGLITRQVDAQIAISHFVADAIGEPSSVVHNGVHPGVLPACPRSDSVVVLQRLEREKDTATALRAWAASELAGAGWRMVIYGRGAERDALRSLTRKLAIDGSVDFPGFVEDPRRVLSRAGILLAPAPAEPFGLAVVEGMAEGVPVVAADGGAHRETLGSHGCYFAAGDAQGCAHQLLRLAESALLRQHLGARLRERQVARFSVAEHVARLEEAYGVCPAP